MSKRYIPKAKFDNPELKHGTQLGEYKIRRLLDSGGMGTVYAGIHPVIGKKVAIKLLHPHIAQNPENIQRFRLEARVVNAIGDPGIVDIFSFGEHTDGRYYFVMEYLKGERLLEFLKRQNRINAFATSQMLRTMALSMAAAHDKNVIHRDLKAENVFLVPSNDGHWPPITKILDFGLAKLLTSIPGQNTPQTRQGITLGTPYYMSPEQCRGLPVDNRSDIYSLGIMAYEMITNSLPFISEDPTEVMHMHLRKAVILDKDPRRPKLFDELVLGMLEKKADDRPQDMREIIATLENIFPPLAPISGRIPKWNYENVEKSSSAEINIRHSSSITDILTKDLDSKENRINTGESNNVVTKVNEGAIDFKKPLLDNGSKKQSKKLLISVFSSGIIVGILLGLLLSLVAGFN
jgi:serine/threonine protein kinase